MGKKTFTLIELIVVIAIIAILAAIITPNAFRAIEKAKISKIEGDFKSLKTVVMAYYSDVGDWPPSDVCCSRGGGPEITVETRNFITGVSQPLGWDGPYIDRWPRTPFRPESSYYDHEYYNYIYACHPYGLSSTSGSVYLQAGTCVEKNAEKIKEDMDGTGFITSSPYTQGGTVRYVSSAKILYYIIANDTFCSSGVWYP